MNKLFFFHPFLIAIYSVLFLYAINKNEFRITVLPMPMGIVLVFAASVFFITYRIVKKLEIAALITSTAIFLSLSFMRFSGYIQAILSSTKLPLNDILVTFVLSCIVFFLIIKVIYREQKKLLVINKLVTFLTLGLVVYSAITIIQYEFQHGRFFSKDTKNTKMKIQPVAYTGDKPDIYYFIFDRYGGPRGLKEQYGFDNSNFLNFLKEKGFYVSMNSTTNYPKTFLSLGSSLNMEYLDFLTKKTKNGSSSDESIVTPYIRNSEVLKFLKERGYRYVHSGSWWEATSINQNADKNYILHYGVYPFADEFTTGFLNTTIAAPILQATFHDVSAVSSDPQNNLHRRMALYQFDNFKEIPNIKGPKFVFAHILLPHDPFVFDKNCNPISERIVNTMQHQENYINQVQCANKKIETLLNQILSESKTKPVIIFQADEGPFPMNSPLPPKQSWATATDTALREKFPILNAYYFPGITDTHLYQTITPVNSFRILFNDYFHTHYQLLPDKNFIFQDEDNYYKFIDVTDKVKN